MTTYGVTIFGKRRHLMETCGRDRTSMFANCGVDAGALPENPKHPENQRAAAFPVCKRCAPCR